MIKMVISPEYFGSNDSENNIRSQLKRLGAYDVNIDTESGFVTAIMTQSNYEEFVFKLKNRVEEKAVSLKDKYNGINSVECNPDYTVFNIWIDKLSKNDRKSVVFELLMTSATYQVISGIPQSDTSIKVNFYNNDGKLIEFVDTSKG